MMGVKREGEGVDVSVCKKKRGEGEFASTRNCKVVFYFSRLRKRVRTTIHAHDSFDPVTSLTLRHNRSISLSDLKLGNFRKSDAVMTPRGLPKRAERYPRAKTMKAKEIKKKSARSVTLPASVWIVCPANSSGKIV